MVRSTPFAILTMPKVSYNVPPDTLVFMLPEPEFSKWANCHFWPSNLAARNRQRKAHGGGPKRLRTYRRHHHYHPADHLLPWPHKLPF
jgi:hypothetical protein